MARGLAPRLALVLLAGALGGCKTEREVLEIAERDAAADTGNDGAKPTDDVSSDTAAQAPDTPLPFPPGPDGPVPPPGPDGPVPPPDGPPQPSPDTAFEDGPPPLQTAPGWTAQLLGKSVDLRDLPGTTDEHAPFIALGPTGNPVAAFEQHGYIHVSQLVDGVWSQLDVINTVPNRLSYQPQLLVEAGGSPTVAWVERDLQDLRRLRVATFAAQKWNQVSAPANGEGSPHPNEAFAPRLVDSSAGRVLAWRTAVAADGRQKLVVTRFDGASWSDLGARFDARPGYVVDGPALAARADRPPVIAWIELAGGEAVLEVRRWNAGASAWDALPVVPGVDAGTKVAIAESSGAVYLAVATASAGVQTVLRLADGAAAWSPIGLPTQRLQGGVLEGLALAVTADDRLAFVWSTPAGAIALGYWTPGQWLQITDWANSLRGGAAPHVAIHPSGSPIYVIWQDQASDQQKVRAMKLTAP